MRTVIAGSTLVFARSLYRSAKDYADNKKWDTELFGRGTGCGKVQEKTGYEVKCQGRREVISIYHLNINEERCALAWILEVV